MWISGKDLSKRLLEDIDEYDRTEFIQYLRKISNNLFKDIEVLFYDDYSEEYDDYNKKNNVLWDNSEQRDVKVGIKIYLAAGSTAIFRLRGEN